MATVFDVLGEPSASPIHDALSVGIDVLGQNQTVEFYPYIRTILPLDGFVFWVNAALLPAAKLAEQGLQSAAPISIPGSLHYASVGHQNDEENIVIRQVDFTAEEQVSAFAELGPDVLYVAVWNTPLGPFKFTFSNRNSFYRQANIYHYVGDAVYPVFDQFLIDNIEGFDQRQIVSNSLPIWMAMFADPPYPSLITISPPVYPAMLVKENRPPPYVAVDISNTRVLQSAPWRGPKSYVNQLCSERVRLITYGLRNDEVMNLRDYILDYSENTNIIGIADPPVITDERRPQVELATIAIKKHVDLSISYLQQRARDIARQYILHATVQVSLNPHEV